MNVEPGVIMTSIFENSAAATRYDKNSPYKQTMRRNGKIFAAGFRAGAQPQQVAETILDAITTPEYRLRWPVGSRRRRPGGGPREALGRGRSSRSARTSTTRSTTRAICEYFGIEL